MPNPQRQVDRLLRDRLTLRETVKVYPRTWSAPSLLVVLILIAVLTGDDGWIAGAIIYGCLLFVCAPLIFEGIMPSATERRKTANKRADMKRQRGLKRGKPRVIVVPEGEYVRIHTWSPRWGTTGWDAADHVSVSFHAEDQDKQAQEYVAEFRARDHTPDNERPSSEAQALAKVLNS